jgi:hypothetical protein
MLTNAIACTIERRLLVNYRIDPEVVERHLPAPFRPQLVSGWAVGGVCFIRLGGLRPVPFPRVVGLTTENVAHRFAVEWDDDRGTQVGVFIPRRDTDSRLTAVAGDRVFPGLHSLARFDVQEDGPTLRIDVASHDGGLGLSVRAHESANLGSQLFGSLEDAIDFFRRGSHGYSPSGPTACLAGVGLECEQWDARPVNVDSMISSMFDDGTVFPKGSCTLDCGLVMRDLKARWITEGVLESRSELAPA